MEVPEIRGDFALLRFESGKSYKNSHWGVNTQCPFATKRNAQIRHRPKGQGWNMHTASVPQRTPTNEVCRGI